MGFHESEFGSTMGQPMAKVVCGRFISNEYGLSLLDGAGG